MCAIRAFLFGGARAAAISAVRARRSAVSRDSRSPPRLIRVDRPIGLDPVGELGGGSPDRRCISCANLITALSAPSATERNTQKRKKRRDANRSGRLRRDQVRQINPFCRLRAMTEAKGKLACPARVASCFVRVDPSCEAAGKTLPSANRVRPNDLASAHCVRPTNFSQISDFIGRAFARPGHTHTPRRGSYDAGNREVAQ